MVVLRLKRMGRRHRPFYRLCAMDKRVSCDGRAIEELGWYDPLASEEKQVSLNLERIDYWLSVGAQPSDTVRSILKKVGCDPTPGKKTASPKAAVAPAPAATTPAPVPAAAPAKAPADKTSE